MDRVQILIVEPEDRLLVFIPERVRASGSDIFSRRHGRGVVVRIDEALVILLKGQGAKERHALA